ncbi:efflux RND transporter periplasmic adaptor subunit [Stratiformator vulcanicus]|uniref:Cation efflux system protein CusB n=1 Tax=Stratiformator vulcanicus TaxID=2527980 RepID=A0A517QYM0_9PLAN|nr:efflux RND transporter periplasmic adaptor subunit [Stratiformator vulcanicus]QDT36746.1 Cation efflux system protein CusB precursor [Stratiformator vulcanicus]
MVRQSIDFSAAMVAVVLVGSIGFAQPPAAIVEVGRVTSQDLSEGRSYVATVMPTKSAVIGSAVDGRVVEFLINEGDRVEKMQPLARLLTETIKKELEAEQAELALLKQELNELKNGSRPQEIEQTRADMAAKKSTWDFYQGRLDRFEQLYRRGGGAVTEDQLQETSSQASAAAENYAMAKATHELTIEGPRTERIAQAEARVAKQQAVVDRIKDQITKHTMIARFAGYIAAEHTEEGAWVSRGDPVAEVVALDEVDVLANIVENDVANLRAGAAARVEVPALKQTLWTGEIVHIVPRADPRSRTFPVKIRVSNKIEDGLPVLKAGMIARVTLPTGPEENTLLVPKDALVLGGPQPMVWVVDPEGGDPKSGKGSVRAVPVKLGVSDEGRIGVTGELKAGEIVVSRGNERIIPPRPGQPSLVRWNTKSARNDDENSPTRKRGANNQ